VPCRRGCRDHAVPMAFWLPDPGAPVEGQGTPRAAPPQGQGGHEDGPQPVRPPQVGLGQALAVQQLSRANSTIMMAFLAARPVVSRPTWK
jgi:hypothetical protein